MRAATGEKFQMNSTSFSALRFSSYRQLMKSRFARNTAVLATGTAVAQAIGILVTPIMARLFTPADYGLLAIFAAVSAITATIISLRYEMRVLIPETENEAKCLVVLVIVLSLALGGILLVASGFLPESYRQWIGISSLGSWLNVAIAAGVLTSVIGVIANWFNRRAEYKKMAAIRIAQALLAAACGLTAGVIGMKNGLIYAQMAALSLVLLLSLSLGYSSLKARVSFQALAATAKTHRNSPLYLLPTALLDVFSIQLPIFLITAWFSSELTGQYRMAYSLLALPGAIVGHAIAQVFFQRISTMWLDPIAIRTAMIKTWKMLAMIGLVPLVVTMLYGEPLFRIVLGPSWGEAGRIAMLLAPMAFSSLIFSPTSTTYIVLRMEHKSLYFGLAALVYRPLALFIGHLLDNLYLGLLLLVVAEILQNSLYSYVSILKLNETARQRLACS
jgi:O-antigen/teichoic acid export membrane protein